MLTKREKYWRERRGEIILPTEIKTLMKCKERLLPSFGSACSMSWSILTLLINFLLPYACMNSVS